MISRSKQLKSPDSVTKRLKWSTSISERTIRSSAWDLIRTQSLLLVWKLHVGLCWPVCFSLCFTLESLGARVQKHNHPTRGLRCWKCLWIFLENNTFLTQGSPLESLCCCLLPWCRGTSPLVIFYVALQTMRIQNSSDLHRKSIFIFRFQIILLPCSCSKILILE